jgi:hypothetical protein
MLHPGRYRWDILEFGRPIDSAPESFATPAESEADGMRALDVLANRLPRLPTD